MTEFDETLADILGQPTPLRSMEDAYQALREIDWTEFTERPGMSPEALRLAQAAAEFVAAYERE